MALTNRRSASCVILLWLYVWGDVQCVEQPNSDTVPGIVPSRRGNEWLHMDKFTIYTHGDQKYVRLYMTVFKPLDVGENGLPTKAFKHKDIWQTNDGLVIIKPDTKGTTLQNSGDTVMEHGLTLDDSPLWVSVGKVRHQIEFLHKYIAQNKGAQPLIRSWLVNYEAVKDIMDPHHMTTEPFSKALNLDINVDQHTPNQFGLKAASTELLRQNTLPGSLVTYVDASVHSPPYPGSWGEVLPVEELRRQFDLPFEGIPGINRLDNSKKRAQFLTDIANDLQNIHDLYKREGFSTDVQLEIQNYNEKYSTTISQDDMEKLADWIDEAKKIKQINDNFYQRNEDGPGKWINIDMDNDMSPIGRDHMFQGFTGDIDETMDRLTESSATNKRLLAKRKRVFQLAEAVVAEVNLRWDEVEPERKKILHRFRKRRPIGEPDQTSTGSLNVFKHADITNDELNKLKLGIGLTENVYEQIRNKIDNKILVHVGVDVSENVKQQIGVGFSDDDIQVLKQKGITENFVLSEDGKVYFTEDGQKRTAMPVIVDKESTVTVVSSNKNWGNLPDFIESYIVGNRISEFEIILKATGPNFNDEDFTVLQKINMGPVKTEIISINSPNVNFVWDIIENRLTMREAGFGFRSGTPVQFHKGHPVIIDKLFEIQDVHAMESTYGTKFKEHQKSKYTGVELFDVADPIADKRKLYLQSDKSVSVQEFLERTTAVKVKGDVKAGNKKFKYHQELLVQVGENEESIKATKFLYDTYQVEGDRRVYKGMIDDNGNFVSLRRDLTSLDFHSSTRIHFIGHGDASGDNLRIGRFSAEELVDSFIRNIWTTDEPTFINKISITACNMDPTGQNQPAVEKGQAFGKDFLTTLTKHDVNAELTIRTGEIQVDEIGRKQYKYQLKGNAYAWRYRNGDPSLIRIDAEGKLEYRTKTNKWSPVANDDADQARKLLVVLKQDGASDLASDIKTGRYHTIEPVAEASGSLRMLLYENSLEHPYLSDEVGHQAVSDQSEAAYWANRLETASDDALSDLRDKASWVPIIDSAEVDSTGGTRVTLFNTETHENTVVSMKSNTYIQFKKRSHRRAMSISQLNTPHKSTRLTLGAGSIMGFGFFINSAVQMSRLRSCRDDGTCAANGSASSLAIALEVHAYMGLAEGSFGVVADSIEIASVVKSVLLARKSINGVVTVTKHAARFLKVATAVGKVSTGVGVVGGAISLGFSAFELHHAQTKAQKVQFGIQVGLEATGLIVTGVTITASIMGASWAGGPIAGVVGFAVGIVTMLINGLVSLGYEFKDTRNNAGIVGEYFYDLDEVYKKGGHLFNRTDKTLSILPHAIVEEINIPEKFILLGSQYIYRTKHGRTGSGKRNYFFWYKDFPKMIKDKSQAINIRAGIGYGQRVSLNTMNFRDITLLLPVVPQSYISYSYKRLPFCTAMHDKGFDVIRRLENDYRFDYDFYIVPGEQIVNSISHEYVETIVQVKLTNSVRTVVIPEYPDMLQQYYRFILDSSGSEHYVILNAGVQLSFRHSGRGVCKWTVDVRAFNETYRFVGNRFRYGSKTSFSFERSSNQELWLVDANGAFSSVDLETGRRRVSHVTVQGQSVNELMQYLHRISSQLMKDQKFIIIRNLTITDTYIGNAFYEVALRRMLYTNMNDASVSTSFKDSVNLLGITDQRAFYMGTMGNYHAIWWSHITNHVIGASYQFYCGNDGYDVTPLGMQGESVLFTQTVEDVSLIYRATHDSLFLLSIDGTRANVERLAEVCFPSLSGFLPLQGTQQFPGDCIYARALPVLPLITTTPDMVHHHYWLFMEDTKPSEDYHEGVFCKPSEPPVTTGIIVPNLPEPECNNLALRGMQNTSDGGTAYMFFCDEENKGYSQINNNTATVIEIPDGIHSLIDKYAPSVFIQSNNGGLYAFEGSANFSLAAVSTDFLEMHTNWKQSLIDLIDRSDSNNMILILGLTTVEDKPIKAWFDGLSESFVIYSPSLQNADNIAYLSASNNPRYAWLYDSENGTLIQQTVMDDADIQSTIKREPSVCWGSETEPEYYTIHQDLVTVEYTAAGRVVGVTSQGVILSFNEYKFTKLLGVNQTWINNTHQHIIRDLDSVCEKYNSQDLITLGKRDFNDTHTEWTWFSCASSVLLSLYQEHGINPNYLGMNSELETAYFSDDRHVLEVTFAHASGKYKRSLTQDQSTFHQKSMDPVQMASRIGDTLLIKSEPFMDLQAIPLLDDVHALVVVPSDSDTTITISEEVWVHYENVIFSVAGTDGYLRATLIVEPPYPCDYPYTESGNSTVFVDVISGHKLILEDFTLRTDDRIKPESPAILTLRFCDLKDITMMSNQDRPVHDYSRQHLKDTPNVFLIGGIAFSAFLFMCVCGAMCRHKCRRRRRKQKARKAATNDNVATTDKNRKTRKAGKNRCPDMDNSDDANETSV